MRQLFFASFNSPKKMAAFRLLPIGKIFKYLFLFVALFTAISYGRFLFTDLDFFEATDDVIEHGENLGVLKYPLALLIQFTVSVFYIFIRVSLIAFVGLGLIKLMKRRGDYRQIWQSTAVAMTVPLLLTLIFDFIPLIKASSIYVTTAIHLLYLLTIVNYYPKQPIKK